MRRRIKYGLLSFFLISFFLMIGASAWLLGTSNGARWLLNGISHYTKVKIDTHKINGRLWDGIFLERLKIKLPQGTFVAEKLYLRWTPLMLLTGNVAIKELSLQKVRIQDNRPEETTRKIEWPRLAGIPARLDGWIDSLHVDDFLYRRLDKNPVIFHSIKSVITWHDGLLGIKTLFVKTPSVAVKGTMSAGLLRPSLFLDVFVIPSGPLAGIEIFSLKVNFAEASEPLLLKGPVTISGLSGSNPKVKITGEFGLTRRSLRMKNLLLEQPERRGKVYGEGELDLAAEKPQLSLNLSVSDFDLSPDLKISTNLSGTFHFEGDTGGYRGRFALLNRGKGWHKAELFGSFNGDKKGLNVRIDKSSWLDGVLKGESEILWDKGVSLKGEFAARNLDPSVITSDWNGSVNLDLKGALSWQRKGRLEGVVSGRILKSKLRGKALTGELEASLRESNIIIDKLALKGKGFVINARGELKKRLTFLADITDLSGLIPGTKGQTLAKGWLARQNNLFAGSIKIDAKYFSADGLKIDKAAFDGQLYARKGYPLKVRANLVGIDFNGLSVHSALLNLTGTSLKHSVDLTLRSLKSEILAKISGTYKEGIWKGKFTRFSGKDSVGPWGIESPFELDVSSEEIFLSPLIIKGVGSERLELGAELIRHPLKGSLKIDWNQINLTRAKQWLKSVSVSGESSGFLHLDWQKDDLSSAKGQIKLSAVVTANKTQINITNGLMELGWNRQGLKTSLDLKLSEGGTFEAKFTSPSLPQTRLPREGEIEAHWQGFDFTFFRQWIPEGLELKGIISGLARGRLLPEQRFEITGNTKVSQGSLRYLAKKGQIGAELRTADLSWTWKGETLGGELTVVLADHGRIRGNFSLPLPARLPISIDKGSPFYVSLEGKVQEKGILTSLFPGLIQESHGELQIDVKAEGIWESPKLEGSFQLSKAGAYFLPAGIQIKDVRMNGRFNRASIFIDTFNAESGSGSINGNAIVELRNWQVASYRGNIKGERFQTFYLPELQIVISPDLSFNGNREKLSVKGDILIPELMVFESTKPALIKPSPDVIIIDAQKKEKQKFPLKLEVNVRVILGEKVFVKAEGIDAQFKGDLYVTVEASDEFKGRGEFHVVKGKYARYGISLDIVRGRIVFSGGPVDRPTLDILALRKVNDVKAGVIVSGTPLSPVVKLYSEPAMPDADILSYMVLGHSLHGRGEDVTLLSKAAGFLLSKGESVVLQEQLKQRLGLDVLDIEEGKGGVSRSILTIGKYLTPRIYVSYGLSLFDSTNVLRLQYKLSKHLQVETQSGGVSGADLIYKIDFR
ncbi:MAG: translocation/assembly module TamB domain-containing protein [Nitrospirota bacterium]